MIKVSAIVSTYNSEKLIRGCLEDLLSQTLYKKGQLEIVVIDSNSQQNEGAIVKEYQQKNHDIKYIRTEQRETVYAAWNRGIEAAQGEYITNANTDDAHRRDALELMAKALDAYPEADLAYCHSDWTNHPNDTFENSHAYLRALYPPYDPAIAMLYCLLGPHPLWRKSVFDKIGLFDSSYEAVGDYDYLLRFVKAKLKAVLVPEVLSLFYINPEGLSRAASRSEKEVSQLRDKYHNEVPIECLYEIDIKNTQAVAQAWIAQGILASRIVVPWEDYDIADLHYASSCFRKALAIDRQNTLAVHNLIAILSRMKKWHECEQLISENRQVLAGKLVKAIHERCPAGLIKIDLPPSAVKPLVYPDAFTYNVSSRPAFNVDFSDGFYGDERKYRWICKSGEMTIPSRILSKPTLVVFDLTCGNAEYYDVFPFSANVLLNDKHIGRIDFNESAEKRIVKMQIGSSTDDATIRLVSESSFNLSLKAGGHDDRELSVSLSNLQIQPLKSVELFEGEIYVDGKNALNTQLLLPQCWVEKLPVELLPGVASYGFHERDGSGYFWMSGAGKIEVSAKLLESPVEVTFALTCGDAKNYDRFPFAVLIFCEDKLTHQVAFHASGQTAKIVLSVEKSGSNAIIILKSSESFIPAQKKINDDKRQLSVQLSNLKVIRSDNR